MMVYMKSSTAEYFCICAEFFSLLKIVNSCRNREKSYLDHIEGYITINECIFVKKKLLRRILNLTSKKSSTKIQH